MTRTRTLLLALLASAGLASLAIAEPKRYELEGNSLKIPGPVVFETGSDKLKPESEVIIDYVKGYLDDKTYISLMRIENHSDSDGNAERNQTLSEKRALAVARALVAKGVDCKRLIAVGFGGSKPIESNSTPEGKAKNRRTTFVNAALRGRPIGGMPVDGGGKVAGDVCR